MVSTESLGVSIKLGFMASKRILLVDDHLDTSRAVKVLLERRGYAIESATSMSSALQLASEQTFDLVISDIGLPDGSGIELITALLRSGPILAIAVSGYTSEADIKRSKDAGFVEHLGKPFNFTHLEEIIKNLLS
jgi:DNA-binding response OmpR family regulator